MQQNTTTLPQKLTLWWQQTGQAHWQRWGIWLTIALILWVSFTQTSCGDDFIRGFYAGMNGECYSYEDRKSLNDTIANSNPFDLIGFILALPFALLLLLVFIVVVGGLHYKLLFRPIFQGHRISELILYFVLCILIYDQLFPELITKITINPEPKEYYNSYSTSIWVVSFIFSIIAEFIRLDKRKRQLERERDRAQVQALKAQINPHFLFNTLNNLYGMSLLEDSPRTATGIEQLSSIMRHAVESSKSDFISVEEELQFLENYVAVQQLRLPDLDTIRVQFEIHWDEQAAQIAPLLLMTFLENAFKFGISTVQPCFIDCSVRVEKGLLTFVCRNSLVERTQLEKGTGTGIENTLRRIKLLYPGAHSAHIRQQDGVFEVLITLTLHD